MAWYADEAFEFTYLKIAKHVLPRNDDLLQLRVSGEESRRVIYTFLIYIDDTETMVWRGDGEKNLKVI